MRDETNIESSYIKEKKMLIQLTQHIWYLPHDDETHRPALGFVSSGKNSLMIDSGNSPDHIAFFYGNTRSIGLPDPEFVALTHWHWDHIFGLSGSPAKSIAQQITNDRLQVMQRWDWSDNSLNSRVAAGLEIPFNADMIKKEMPIRHSFKIKIADISFMEECFVRIEDIFCHLIHIGGPHSDDSVIVYIPSEKVLFVGDCCAGDPYSGNGIQLKLLSETLDKLNQFDADWFVPSHGDPQSKEDFMTSMRKVEKIGKIVGELNTLEAAREALKKEFKREPNEEEIESAQKFVNGNTIPPFQFSDKFLKEIN